jgi:diguanylate cyclase (GGDEF)-like protein
VAKAVLLAALAAASPWVCAQTAMHHDASEPASTRAAAFDETFQRVIGPASLETTTQAYEADLERLRALLPANDPVRDLRFRSVYCGSLRWKDAEQGLAYSDAALRRARDVRDLASEARAMLCRAAYIMQTSGSQRGLPELDKAIALLQNTPEQQLLAESLESRGDVQSLLGEQAKAMLDFQRARAAYRGAEINREVEPLMLSIAVAYRRMGDWQQAERYFSRAVSRMQDRMDWEGVATNLIQMGFLHGESGNLAKAQEAFQRAIDIATRHHDDYSLNSARLGLAEIQTALGDPDAALATLALARAGFAADQDTASDDMLALLQGQALARKGQHAAALERYLQALPLIERNGNQRYLALLYKARATSHEALGKTAQALADYKQYTDLQMKLQGKMRLEQGRLLEYEYEIRRREFENRQLRAQAQARQLQLAAGERIRQWQTAALALGVLLLAMLAWLAWRQWAKSRAMHTLAMQDPLTGAASRIGIEEEAARALAQAHENGKPLSLLMLDLDHFKDINDGYGHAAGDTVLRAAVNALEGQLRGRDPLGRVGGEEFVVVCADTREEQAIVVAQRLLEATRALRFPGIDAALRVTVSIGIAQCHPKETRDSLLDRVDAALYRAKQRGRDRAET